MSPLVLHKAVGTDAWTNSFAGDTGWSNAMRYTPERYRAQSRRPAAPAAPSTNVAAPPTRGYDYSLSKRTGLYAFLLNDKVTSFENEQSLALGIRHRF